MNPFGLNTPKYLMNHEGENSNVKDMMNPSNVDNVLKTNSFMQKQDSTTMSEGILNVV